MNVQRHSFGVLVLSTPLAIMTAAGALLSWIPSAHAQPCQSEEFSNVGPQELGYGAEVVADGNRALIRDSGWYDVEPRVYVVERSGGEWVETAELTEVAEADGALALDDSLALIGHPGYLDAVGAAHVYRKTGGFWVYEAQLLSSDADGHPDYCCFGNDVAVSGQRLAVLGHGTAPSADGAAYVFEGVGGEWVETAKLSIEGWPAAHFIEFADDVIVFSVERDESPWHAVLVFRFVDGEWLHEDTLVEELPYPHSHWGKSLAFDGTRLAVGSTIFRHDQGSWEIDEEVPFVDYPGGCMPAPCLALDGDVLAVAQMRCRIGEYVGVVSVYLHDGNAFNEAARLVHPNTWSTHSFGSRIALANDVVLATLEDLTDFPTPPYGVAAYHGISDCDSNGELDLCQVMDGTLEDADGDGTADICQELCPWDLNDNGFVEVLDFLTLLFSWGPCDDPGNCPADFDGDGTVGVWDFLALLAWWGPCP
jgi:hypothetical protein